MSSKLDLSFIRRASIEGALCTVRCVIGEGEIPNTKGEWLGIEWDDSRRGKHDGTHQGRRYFFCKSSQPTVASFIRPSRKFDTERTVLEAVRYKYGGGSTNEVEAANDVVVISGKVAQEIGFDKIAREQSVLEDLKIVVLENLVINGIAPRGSDSVRIKEAQAELAATCPNVIELDLGYNTIETWEDVCNICIALPRLRILRLNGLKLHSPIKTSAISKDYAFQHLRELHLNETLLQPLDVLSILGNSQNIRIPGLTKLWISQNELDSFALTAQNEASTYPSVEEIVLENNLFKTLDCLEHVVSTFPTLKSISFQRNLIKTISYETSNNKEPHNLGHFPRVESLSVSHNQISSFDFIDTLSRILPNLASLRISGNPLYDNPQSDLPTTNPSETNYYLTLARIPSLRMLNYSQITSREREEGEIYYLSIADRNIKALVATPEMENSSSRMATLKRIQKKYALYQSLCRKYDRESLIDKLSSLSNASVTQVIGIEKHAKYPAGSIAAQLINATFYIAQRDDQQSTTPLGSETQLSRPIPSSIPTSQIFARVARWFSLPPLQFKLVYESNEFDPTRDDITTRSQLYADDVRSASDRYRAWGDWDADELVERSIREKASGDQAVDRIDEENPSSNFSKKDRKGWKRREVQILTGYRSWGDWLDSGVDEARIRIEPF